MNNKYLYLISICFLILITKQKAHSQDRVFARTYQSNVLTKGNIDIEIWNTYSFGREDFYAKQKQRLEFEIGVTDRLQTAFYLNNSTNTSLQKDSISGNIKTSSSSVSFSNEWKYKISDPVANAIGFAAYGELTLHTHEIELEAKLIFDKRLAENLFAINLVAEAEFEAEFEKEDKKAEFENEKNKFEIDAAYMHLNGKGLGLGLELQNRNAFVDGDWIYSALYAGPTLSFHSAKNWWLILNAMPQLTNLKKYKTTESLELKSNEKYDLRLLFAITL